MPVKLKPAKRGDLVASSFHIIHEKLHPNCCLCDGGGREVMDLMPFGRTGGVACWFVERNVECERVNVRRKAGGF